MESQTMPKGVTMDMHIRITLGKHKGEKFEHIPVDYLEWMVKKLTEDEGFKRWALLAAKEIKRRRKLESRKRRHSQKTQANKKHRKKEMPVQSEMLEQSDIHSATLDNPHPDRHNPNRKSVTLPNGVVAHIPINVELPITPEECPF